MKDKLPGIAVKYQRLKNDKDTDHAYRKEHETEWYWQNIVQQYPLILEKLHKEGIKFTKSHDSSGCFFDALNFSPLIRGPPL